MRRGIRRPELAPEMVRLYQEGEKIFKIADRFNCTQITVMRTFKRIGFAWKDARAPQAISNEQWLPIADCPGYEVSDFGRVASYWKCGSLAKGQRELTSTRVVLRGTTNKDGYQKFVLVRDNGKTRQVAAHVLVLETFVGPRPHGMFACHNNGDATNSSLCNLRWDTPRANLIDCLNHGGHSGIKLNAEKVTLIWGKLANGESLALIARHFNISSRSVKGIKNKMRWSHITNNLQPLPRALFRTVSQDGPVFVPKRFCSNHSEIWRPVNLFPDCRVSNFGRVQTRWTRGGTGHRSVLGESWNDLPNYRLASGHVSVCLRRGVGQCERIRVHLIVLNAFAGPRPHGLVACHIDGNPTNNHARNLRWDTCRSNCLDWVKHRAQKKQSEFKFA